MHRGRGGVWIVQCPTVVYRLCVGIVVCWVMVWVRGVKGVIAGGYRDCVW